MAPEKEFFCINFDKYVAVGKNTTFLFFSKLAQCSFIPTPPTPWSLMLTQHTVYSPRVCCRVLPWVILTHKINMIQRVVIEIGVVHKWRDQQPVGRIWYKIKSIYLLQSHAKTQSKHLKEMMLWENQQQKQLHYFGQPNQPVEIINKFKFNHQHCSLLRAFKSIKSI